MEVAIERHRARIDTDNFVKIWQTFCIGDYNKGLARVIIISNNMTWGKLAIKFSRSRGKICESPRALT